MNAALSSSHTVLASPSLRKGLPQNQRQKMLVPSVENPEAERKRHGRGRWCSPEAADLPSSNKPPLAATTLTLSRTHAPNIGRAGRESESSNLIRPALTPWRPALPKVKPRDYSISSEVLDARGADRHICGTLLHVG